jgi:hypothetical protein
MAATKYSSDFNWSQSPSTSLTTAGAKTVNLPACVAGVLASEPQYYVYVAGTGTAEGLFSSRSGTEKKSAAMSFVSAALQLTDAVTSRHIIDPEKFKQGLSAVIDGTVLCLNASTWAKPSQPAS